MSNTWRGDSIRGSHFDGWDGAQESFIRNLAANQPDKQLEMIKDWEETLSRRNGEAKDNWNAGVSKNAADGLDDKTRFASEDNMRATAARNVIGEMMEKGLISYETMNEKRERIS